MRLNHSINNQGIAMRNFKFISIILLLTLVGCNLPTRQATPEPDLVSTSVALTLTTSPIAIEPISTVAIQETSTPLPLEASATPSLTPEPTTTHTSTPVVDDIRQAYGSPTWSRSMEDGKSFGLDASEYDDGNTKFSVSNGVMSISSNSTIGFRGWRLSNPTPQNMYLEGTFRSTSCSGNDTYGLVFRAADYTSGYGYYAGFTCDGKYLLTRWDSAGTSTVISSTESDLILKGSNQINRLGILADGNNISLYANGKFLKSINDSGITSGGHIGPFISAYSGGFNFELDEIAYWNLP